MTTVPQPLALSKRLGPGLLPGLKKTKKKLPGPKELGMSISVSVSKPPMKPSLDISIRSISKTLHKEDLLQAMKLSQDISIRSISVSISLSKTLHKEDLLQPMKRSLLSRNLP